jgi:two-component system sensor kinase FixL
MITPAFLHEGPESATPSEVCGILEFAGEQAVRAGQIVRSMRDFVTKRRDTDRQLEDLSKLTEAASTLALPDAKERGVNVTFQIPRDLPPVLVDRIQIQQVLLNLLRNALEAMVPDKEGDDGTTAQRGRPELTVVACASGPTMVEIAVADTGPGLAPEVADCLFNAFVSTKPDGMGLGLSICQSIIQAHGGQLWADSNPAGAVFRFTLPTGLHGA